MKKVVIILFFFIFFSSLVAHSGEFISDLDKEKRKLETLKAEIRKIEKELQKIKKTKSGLEEYLKRLEYGLSTIESNINRVNTKIYFIKKKIKNIEARIAYTNKEINNLSNLLSDYLYLLYRNGKDKILLKILLTSSNIGDFMMREKSIAIVTKEAAYLIKSLKSKAYQLKKEKEALEKEKEALYIVLEQKELERQKYKLMIQAKRETIKRLSKDEAYFLKTKKELEESSKKVQSIIESLNKKTKEKRYASLKKRKGILSWPVKGKVVSLFGKKVHPEFKTVYFSSGIDILAKEGEKVRAAADGEVIYVGSMRGLGKLVIIYHGGNIATIYAYLKDVLVKNHDVIRRGTVIGTVGLSPKTGDPTLHFEVRVDTAPVDPLQWL